MAATDTATDTDVPSLDLLEDALRTSMLTHSGAELQSERPKMSCSCMTACGVRASALPSTADLEKQAFFGWPSGGVRVGAALG